jgi:chromosome segregation ATPase
MEEDVKKEFQKLKKIVEEKIEKAEDVFKKESKFFVLLKELEPKIDKLEKSFLANKKVWDGELSRLRINISDAGWKLLGYEAKLQTIESALEKLVGSAPDFEKEIGEKISGWRDALEEKLVNISGDVEELRSKIENYPKIFEKIDERLSENEREILSLKNDLERAIELLTDKAEGLMKKMEERFELLTEQLKIKKKR